MCKKSMIGVMVFCAFGLATIAAAEPMLQLYLEGGTYDPTTESWVVNEGPVRLWVIGNTSSPHGSIMDVKLAVAYSATETPIITLTGTKTEDYGGFGDPSKAADPVKIQTVTDGSVPLLSDGTALPTHDIFGPGTAWQEFSLGDFTLQDSPLADFINEFPSPGPKGAQINVYTVNVEGASVLHFDAYDHFEGETLARFAPFSHDGGTGTVPAPAAALLALIGMGTINLMRRYFR